MKFKYKSQQGATLIEVLVAVLVFSFGLLGIIGLQARGIQYSGNTEDRNRAAALAAEIAGHMYTMRNINLSATAPAIVTAWTTKVQTPANGGIPGATGSITINAATGTTPAFATISIVWQPVNASKPSRYETDVLSVTETVPIPAQL